MTTYHGFTDNLKKLAMFAGIGIAITALIALLVPNPILKIFFIALTLPFVHLAYQGMIQRIVMNESQVVIYRPLSVQRIKLSDVAFCAVHSLENGRSLVYCFTRKRFRDGVNGIKSKEGFDAIVRKLMADQGDLQTNLDINFHRAKKIPLAFVENGDQLKENILLAVDKIHVQRFGAQ